MKKTAVGVILWTSGVGGHFGMPRGVGVRRGGRIVRCGMERTLQHG